MKQIFFFFFYAFILFNFSCKKDSPAHDTGNGNKISSHNPKELSAAIKVFHGQRMNGLFPAATNSTPVITGPATIKSLAGRYGIIKPELVSGEISGYNLEIAGSGEFFKVDFTKPRNIDGRNRPGRRGNILERPLSGNADSSIVIGLPANIQVPDTFCIRYAPYDDQGNIGKPVTTCIIVNNLGGDANSAWLLNEWKETASWDLVNGQRQFFDTVIYNQWRPEINFYYEGYTCVKDADSINYHLGEAPPGSLSAIVMDSVYTRKRSLKFAVNGAFASETNEDYKEVDDWQSTCTDFTFFALEPYERISTAAWNYNSDTKKMLVAYEFDADGYPNPQGWEYDVITISDNEFILNQRLNNSYFRYER